VDGLTVGEWRERKWIPTLAAGPMPCECGRPAEYMRTIVNVADGSLFRWQYGCKRCVEPGPAE